MKKTISLLCALFMAFSSVSIPVKAEEEIETEKTMEEITEEVGEDAELLNGTYGDLTYEISDGKVTITDCDESATSVVIPEEIEGYPVTSIGYEAFYQCSSLTDIIIPNSVTSIEDRAFMNCSSLPSIELPDGITNISNTLFANCTNLTSVTIPDSVTNIGEHAFNSCSSLINITIPDGVTNIGRYAFNGCSSLTNISIPDGITKIEYATFSCCSSLSSITIPDKVTYISPYAFCASGLSGEVYIPPNVSFIDGMAFSKCHSLTSIKVDENNTAYRSEDGLLYSSDFRTLVNCPAGKSGSLIIHDGVKTIGENAFDSCDLLDSIQMPDTVQIIKTMAFSGCRNIKEIVIPDSVTTIGKFAFCNLFEVEYIKLSKNLQNISDYCFSANRKLKNIEIPHGVNTIGQSAFQCCYDLESIVLPQSITYIGDEAFNYCHSLDLVQYSGTEKQWENITFGSKNDNLTRTQIVFSDGERERAKPQWSFDDGVLIISGTGDMTDCAFWGDYGTDAPWNFQYQNDIKEVVIEPGVTSIGEVAFACLPALEHITIGEDVTRIGGNGIAECPELKEIVVPDGVKEIDFFAFNSDVNLETIVLPSTISKIGDYAFRYCYSLKNVFYLGSEEQWNTVDDGAENIYWITNALRFIDEITIPETITLDHSEVDLNIGETIQLEALILPENAEQILVWMSDNNKVVRVSQDGFVKSVGTGTTVIKAKTINGISSTCIVNVIDPNHIHVYGKPEYIWSADNSTVTAKAVCEHDASHVITETVKTTVKTVDATCEATGSTTYTATFKNELFSEQTKVVEIPALGHDWQNLVWTWAEDYSKASVTFTCAHDASHTKTIETEITKETDATSCEEPGLVKYTAKAVLDGTEYIDSKEVYVEAVGHAWGEPLYEWSADNRSVTAIVVCKNDPSHKVTETVQTTVSTVDATCETAGSTTYTATFTNELFSEQTKVVEIPASGHEYGEPVYEWAEDYSTTTAKAICEHDANHVITETVKTTVKTIDATCETAGSTTYTATFTNELFSEQSKVVEIPALGHKYGEPTYEWASDNSSVTAKAICEHDTSHVITETVQTTSETIPATEDKDGSTTYTAVFTNEMFTTQTKVIVIPATGPQPIHVTGVGLNKTELTLRVGKSETLTATVLPEDTEDKSVTWSSSDPSAAKVDANGKVTAVADKGIAEPSKAVITVTTNDGSYTASCTVTVEDPINAFVRRIYKIALGRDPEAEGLSAWANNLKTGKSTAAQVVEGFFNSNEMNGLGLTNEEYVRRCYLVMMDREPDDPGLAAWKEHLDIGMSVMNVLSGFVGSNEFKGICEDYGVTIGTVKLKEPRDQNYGVTAFVFRCYTEVLGRAAETDGLNAWCKSILNAAEKKKQAVWVATNGFFHSGEFLDKNTSNEEYLTILYKTFLGREPEEDGFNAWMKVLNRGNNRDSVMMGFANSDEFIKIMAKYGIK